MEDCQVVAIAAAILLAPKVRGDITEAEFVTAVEDAQQLLLLAEGLSLPESSAVRFSAPMPSDRK